MLALEQNDAQRKAVRTVQPSSPNRWKGRKSPPAPIRLGAAVAAAAGPGARSLRLHLRPLRWTGGLQGVGAEDLRQDFDEWHVVGLQRVDRLTPSLDPALGLVPKSLVCKNKKKCLSCGTSTVGLVEPTKSLACKRRVDPKFGLVEALKDHLTSNGWLCQRVSSPE